MSRVRFSEEVSEPASAKLRREFDASRGGGGHDDGQEVTGPLKFSEDVSREVAAASFGDQKKEYISPYVGSSFNTHDGVVVDDELREHVADLIVAGASQKTIAEILNISEPTLRKYFRNEIDHAVALRNANVAAVLYKMAQSGKCVTANIFWLKARAHWRDGSESNLPGNTTNVGVSVVIGGVDADL